MFHGPWEHILKCKNYVHGSSILISAEYMKACAKTWTGPANQFEPRLLAYISSSADRPNIFKEHGLCLLPVKNGEYLLTTHNIYKGLGYDAAHVVQLQRDTTSLVLDIGKSETSLLDNLRYSKVFERPEFLNEPITHGPLLNGRHRCNMDMKLYGEDISIRGVQYEIDSCFESANKVLLIEGKSSTAPIDSFNIRQLYFPYRVIKEKVGKKEIICLFIHQLKDIIHIWKYQFEDSTSMDSIKEVGHYTYSFI